MASSATIFLDVGSSVCSFLARPASPFATHRALCASGGRDGSKPANLPAGLGALPARGRTGTGRVVGWFKRLPGSMVGRESERDRALIQAAKDISESPRQTGEAVERFEQIARQLGGIFAVVMAELGGAERRLARVVTCSYTALGLVEFAAVGVPKTKTVQDLSRCRRRQGTASRERSVVLSRRCKSWGATRGFFLGASQARIDLRDSPCRRRSLAGRYCRTPP